jgi:hypothetical protein
VTRRSYYRIARLARASSRGVDKRSGGRPVEPRQRARPAPPHPRRGRWKKSVAALRPGREEPGSAGSAGAVAGAAAHCAGQGVGKGALRSEDYRRARWCRGPGYPGRQAGGDRKPVWRFRSARIAPNRLPRGVRFHWRAAVAIWGVLQQVDGGSGDATGGVTGIGLPQSAWVSGAAGGSLRAHRRRARGRRGRGAGSIGRLDWVRFGWGRRGCSSFRLGFRNGFDR